MPYKYDKKTIVDNINILLKDKGILIGEFEKNTKVSKGYLSRMKDSKSSLSAEFLMAACNELGCDLDELVIAPLNELTDDEKLIYNLIQSLIQRTEQRDIHWQGRGSGKNITDKLYRPNELEHPLFMANVDESGYYVNNEPAYLYQNIVPLAEERTSIHGDIYHVAIREEGWDPIKEIYIAHIIAEDHPDNDDYELFLYDLKPAYGPTHQLHPLCSTRQCKSQFRKAMKKLYEVAAESTNRIFITPDMKDVLSDFIQNGVIYEAKSEPDSPGDKTASFEDSAPEAPSSDNKDDDIPF